MCKKVKIGTIGTALRRLEKSETGSASIKLQFKLSGIGIKSPLYEVTYPIRDFDFSILATIYKELDNDAEFIASTQGSQEITLIVSQLAVKKTDLIEIISTYTEVIFIVKQNDLSECFSQLKKLLQ